MADPGTVPDRPLRVLLIGGQPDDSVQIRRLLREEGPALRVWQVRSEKNLALALARPNFDLVLIEACLPWTDCLSAIQALKTRAPGCPVVLIVDPGDESPTLAVLEAGVDSYALRVSAQLVGLPTAVQLAIERARERRSVQEIEARHLTERTQAELALREGAERFRTIIEQSPISIQVMTPDGWTVQVNQAWEQLWGVTAADVQHYNMLHDEQARSLGMMPYVERGFAGEVVVLPPVAYHTPETLKTGRKRWFQARIYPVKGDQGEIRHVIMMYEDITERQWATEDLRRLSAELLNAEESERKRISQELHDELGQVLTAMRINLAALEKDLATSLAPSSRERLAETSALADQMLAHVRELSHDLRPTMLDELGLAPTLRWYANRFARRLGIEIELEAVGFEGRLAAEIETVVYRIVQEAFTNIARHAQASRVHLRLAQTGSRVTTVIEDDGVGFDVTQRLASDAPGMGVGLFRMRERVTLRGGTFSIQSRPGTGTRLAVELPLDRR